jgi:galactokinase
MSVLEPDRLRRRLAELQPGLAGEARDALIVRAPGRINVIGEHTDYNDGFVLPAAIGLETWLAFVPSADRTVSIALDATGEVAGFELDDVPAASGRWIDYVAGVAWVLARRGTALRGIRGLLAGTLPVSAGLSSSAALELVAALAMAAEPPEGMALALACQQAENEWVGVQCGIMDQFAERCGVAGHAMLLDCRSLEHRSVGLPLDAYALVVCDTRSPRRLSASEYNARRRECERAVGLIAVAHPEVRALRDVSPEMLDAVRPELDPVSYRRSRHVVDENARVLSAVEALREGRVDEVGELLNAGHVSLRDLFEVSSGELDALVEIASGVEGVAGSRMTGAGFGGCTISLVARDAIEELRSAVEGEYPRRTGREAAFYVVDAVDGAGPVAG